MCSLLVLVMIVIRKLILQLNSTSKRHVNVANFKKTHKCCKLKRLLNENVYKKIYTTDKYSTDE